PGRVELGFDSLPGLAAGDDEAHPLGQPVGDRIEMRPYVPGDSPRTIAWKIYGRTGKLVVRAPERARIVSPRGCAYQVAGPHDESTAAVARAVLERGFLGQEWRFGADGSE